MNYIQEIRYYIIQNLFDQFKLLILYFYLSLNGSNKKFLMNFYLIRKTQLNYERNQGTSQKIGFNIIEYLKKPVENIKKIHLLSESYRKMLLYKQKFCLEEIIVQFLANETLLDFQMVVLSVKVCKTYKMKQKFKIK